MNQKKPRVAIYYNNKIRNDGPPLYYFNVLKRQLGLDTIHLLPEGDTRSYGKFDLHFWVDFGEDSFLSPEACEWMPPKDEGKTIYVCSDAHLGPEYRFKKARQFDYVFFNQERAAKEYMAEEVIAKRVGPSKSNQKVAWLPHAAEPQAYPHFETLKKYDVAFIGHIQEQPNFNGITRVELLDRAFKEFPNFFFGTRQPAFPGKNMFEDASKRFCESKVVLNISIGDDLNMRLFEILSSGAFQLTNWLPTMEEIGLKDGVHLATYKTLDEMVEKARYYIEHEEEREKIAQAGHEAFLSGHTYKHRILQILKTVGFPLEEGGEQ